MLHFQLPAAPPAPEEGFLNLGHHNPARRTLAVNSRGLVLDGRPWLPVMGEFHYSRYPAGEWADELAKVKAGGVDIVASYVIWNHHEPAPERQRWDGERDLARFVDLAAAAGLLVYLRPGPWVHAEVHLGGFPDWLPQPQRCNDAIYLLHVQRWFSAIAAQLRGRLWQDGGPVIGLQLENEYGATGPGRGREHIAALKRLALDAGLRVPLYTVTGWPTLDIPEREVVPVSGAYADGFWQGARTPLPPSGVFLFNTRRVIGEMGNVDGTPAAGLIDTRHYPFFLAEAGGGMHVSYHRRPVVTADDVYATALVQIGSGANLYGYYMLHGGTNPQPEHGPLHETQASGYPNDVPQLGYDFHAPLGQYGQVRPSWGRLRTLHLMLQAFGETLVTWDAVLPEGAPQDAADRTQPRLALRGAGDAGLLFVNHHVRHHPLPPHSGLQVRVETAAGARVLPERPFDLAPGAAFVWPLGWRIGAARLRHATVQPLTQWQHGGATTWVGFTVAGQAPELVFDGAGVLALALNGQPLAAAGDAWRVRPAGERVHHLALTDAAGTAHELLLLTAELAERAQRLMLRGRTRLVLSSHALSADADGGFVLHRPAHEAAWVRAWPADGLDAAVVDDGWACWTRPPAAPPLPAAQAVPIAAPGSPPAVTWGPHVAWRDGPVPCAPDDAAFAQAAGRWRLALPPGVQPAHGRLLAALRYVGDVARLYADGRLVDDHFYDGDTWWIGLDRHADGNRWPTFELRILPLAEEAPIFLEDTAWALRRAAGCGAAVLDVALALWLRESLRLG